ncbi:MAG: hypothetical protein K6E27_08840 [Eubacterium sp.]|nr:hypothetical protein [Eubacterium sp.]
MANFIDVINSFVNGATEGISSGQGNLKIKGDVLIHYATPILERFEGKYILNFTRYSIVTGRLQKQIKEIIDDGVIIQVTKVPEGYKGSLKDFIKR